MNHWLQSGNNAALTNDNAYPEELRLAAPTPEHWWPLLYVIGAKADDETLTLLTDEIVGKSLSMTSVLVGDERLAA